MVVRDEELDEELNDLPDGTMVEVRIMLEDLEGVLPAEQSS